MLLLEGYTALDLTDLRGQMCGKVLRDLGVEVVKVEPPAGDPVRRLGPFAHDTPGLERSLRFAWLNGGKQSLTLDLAQPQGRDLLLRLAEQADVLLESGDPGALDALGLGATTLRARNPRLVVTSVSGFGQDGPHRDYLAPELVAFALGGLMYVSGDPALPPVKGPETQASYYASLYAALGTLLALWRRDAGETPSPQPPVPREGTGGFPAEPAPATPSPNPLPPQGAGASGYAPAGGTPPFPFAGGRGAGGVRGQGTHVDVAVQETLASQEHLIRAFGLEGHNIERYGSQHATVAPANVFPTKDGYVYLFVSRPHWRLLLNLMPDHDPGLDDPKWLANHLRRAHAEWINAEVERFTRQYAKDELVRLLQENGIPCLPVNAPGEFVRDEQIQYRGLFQPTTHPALGEYAQPAFPAVMDGERVPAAAPPLLGQHTAAILRDRLGLAPAEIELLFAQGII
ncbi:MAG TPA: CoA transferase [Chloroflexota bacterium]|jgi:crotonobetainyl-CoA:carnitine CoA-transferase CaiB-like acyl-CoA transferase